MAELKDILYALNDMRHSVDEEGHRNESIFRRAEPAILNFPVLVSDGISLEDLTMIIKALEREYSTVVRLAMGLDDIIDGDHGEYSKIDYIKKFHTNNHSLIYDLESVNKENLMVSEETRIDDFNDKALLRESLGLNMSNLNDMTNKNDRQFITLSEARIKETTRGAQTTTRDGRTDSSTVTDRNGRTENGGRNYHVTRSNGGNGRGANGGRGGESRTTDAFASNTTSTSRDVADSRSLSQSTDKTTYGLTREFEYSTMTNWNDYHAQLVDNDIKKANELIPTTLDITVYQKTEHEVITDHILLGVKCTSHKVTSKEMVENIQQTLETKKGFFRFIRWTTGEIKFFRDYLLCLDMIKKEALRSRSKDKYNSAAWFRELKSRATISKLKASFNLKNQLIPNCTLVMTMDEVDMLRNVYGIDLLKSMTSVKQLFDTYFLIGLVIVDSAAEIAYFAFDGMQKYQMFSFNALERENRNQGNDIKALVSLMSKY